MPHFKKCPPEVRSIANDVLTRHESHKAMLDAKVTVDLVFAFCDRDEETNEPLNDALTHQGVKALGIARIIPLKDRVMGRGDAEISIDGDWWMEKASGEQQEALLDHELHHLTPKLTKGQYVYDAHGRPKLRMRKHDFQFGWFACVAERNGKHSIEQAQAKCIMDMAGQFFWPNIAPTVESKQLADGKKKK